MDFIIKPVAPLGNLKRGQTVSFEIPFSFSLYRITILQVTFEAQTGWFTVTDLLPTVFNQGLNSSSYHLHASLTVPQDAALQTYFTPFKAYAEDPEGQKGESAGTVSFTVSDTGGSVEPPPFFPPGIPPEIIQVIERVLGNPYTLIVLAAAVAWFGYYSLRRR